MALVSITLAPTLAVALTLSGGGSTLTLGPPAPTVMQALFEVLRGPAGESGNVSFVHEQAIALAVWTVPHNLGRRPAVTVTDHLGRVIEPDLAYLDVNLVQITHGLPLAGFAYCN